MMLEVYENTNEGYRRFMSLSKFITGITFGAAFRSESFKAFA